MQFVAGSCWPKFVGCLIGFFLVLVTARPVRAVGPPDVSDEELAVKPIVVVARWNQAPCRRADPTTGPWSQVCEMTTEIDVKRVVWGDMSHGAHQIHVAPFVGWTSEKPRVTYYGSTEEVGDADATSWNLWFLDTETASPGTKQERRLRLGSFRGVQPLELEEYYSILRTDEYEGEIRNLLHSKSELVVLRTLEAIAGGIPPWPYEGALLHHRHRGWDVAEAPIVGRVGAVREVIFGTRSESVRRVAAAVYSHLAGECCVDTMRSLLSDEDPVIRGIAIGALVLHRDAKSVEAMAGAAVGLEDAQVACEVIERLRAWKSECAVPVLIEFLQNDSFYYAIGSNVGVPAVKAKEALREITNCVFPFDVKVSRKAWRLAEGVPCRERRQQRLKEILGLQRDPWHLEIGGDRGRALAILTNRSESTLTIAKRPARITVTDSRGSMTCGGGVQVHGRDDFASVGPGESVRVPLPEREMLSQEGEAPQSPHRQGEIELLYLRNGNEFGLNAWIGLISNRSGERTPVDPFEDRNK